MASEAKRQSAFSPAYSDSGLFALRNAFRGAVSQEAAEDAQAAEAIALNDLKVSEADAAIAAVLKDDAAAQYRLDAVVLAQHELKAPFDARVIARLKEPGSVAKAGEAVLTLIEPQSIWAKANVDESLAGGLKGRSSKAPRCTRRANRFDARGGGVKEPKASGELQDGFRAGVLEVSLQLAEKQSS